jgi:hypothetical protein
MPRESSASRMDKDGCSGGRRMRLMLGIPRIEHRS